MMEYFARVIREENDYVVVFPDFPNVNTFGTSMEEALANGKEALNGALESDFERGYALPKPTDHRGKKSYHPIPILPHIEIAYELRKIRKGQSQSEVAAKLGITYQAYQKLENPRKCNPTIKTLEKIGDALGRELRISFR
jgi:antitoxin HicB